MRIDRHRILLSAAALLAVSLLACTETTRRWYSGPCAGDGPCGSGGTCLQGQCGRPCATSADCGDGVCVAKVCTPPELVCKTSYCDDANACTDDFCNTQNAACRHELHSGPCSDGNICTVGDECVEAGGVFACKSAPKCDDGDPATKDSCDPKTAVCSNTK